MKNSKNISAGFVLLPVLLVILVLVVAGGGAYAYYNARQIAAQQSVACTQEAKICPDGSSVGRTGPNCEFAACPEAQSQTSIAPTEATDPTLNPHHEGPQTVAVAGMSKYTDTDFGFSFWYPAGWVALKKNNVVKLIDPKDPTIDQYNDGTWITFTEVTTNIVNDSDAMRGNAVYTYNPTSAQLSVSTQGPSDAYSTAITATVTGTTLGGQKIYQGNSRYGTVIIPFSDSKILVVSSPSGAASSVGAVAGTVVSVEQAPTSADISAAFQSILKDHYYLQELCRQKGISDASCKD